MTLHLWLMRHAKSDWDDPTLADHARPLSRRGRRAAARLGGWLVAEGAHPDEVIASDARRTRETWARVAAAARPLGTAALRLEPRLYLAPPETMAEVLGGAAGRGVLLIGHNPGIGHVIGTDLAVHHDLTGLSVIHASHFHLRCRHVSRHGPRAIFPPPRICLPQPIVSAGKPC